MRHLSSTHPTIADKLTNYRVVDLRGCSGWNFLHQVCEIRYFSFRRWTAGQRPKDHRFSHPVLVDRQAGLRSGWWNHVCPSHHVQPRFAIHHTYRLVVPGTSWVVDLAGGNSEWGTPIILYRESGAKNQIWKEWIVDLDEGEVM